jgi:glycosyltransferase involved in cell wall biosynthesis
MIVCAPHLGLDPASDLGGEVSERALLERLGRMGERVRLLMPPEADAGPGAPNWTVERWRRRRARRWWRSNGACARALTAAYQERPFDLAHIHSGLHLGRGALTARRRLRAPFPIVVHHHHLEGGLLRRSLEAAACRAADAVVVPSRFAARALVEEAGGEPARLVVIPRGVDSPAHLRAPAGAPAGGRRVLVALGRLVRRKNPLLLVEAMAEVERALPGAALLRFIGEGPLARAIDRRARALGIEAAIERCGRLDEGAKWRALGAASICVCASRLEGYCLAAAEAMAAGVPVVAPRRASFPEVIEDGVSGLLVAPDDARALAASVVLLLRNPGRLRALGEAAQRRAEAEFSWDAAALRLRDLYRDLVAGARRPA